MTMNRFFKTISATVCMTIMMLSLTGCDGTFSQPHEETEKPAVAFVLANTANSQPINLDTSLVKDTISNCAENYGYVSVINCDGSPTGVYEKNMDIDPQYKTASDERLEIDARNRANQVLEVMNDVVAIEPEVDFLEGLRLAAKSLNSLDGYTTKSIIVLGTGLSTTGDYVNFTRNLLSAEPETIADLLEEKKAIPDFTGQKIYWQGMAETDDPQEPLTPEQKEKLQSIWNEIIKRGGGELEVNEYISFEEYADKTVQYPNVSVVDIPTETPVEFSAERFGEGLNKGPVSLTEKQVSFAPDSSKYLYPEEAAESIKPIADYLKKHEDVTILLAGTTAGDEDNDYTLKLSEDRALAVKKTITDLGVEENRIIAVGLGSTNDPWHVWGVGEGEAASSNRKVMILDSSTSTAKGILGQ